jgi:hypothetical protein
MGGGPSLTGGPSDRAVIDRAKWRANADGVAAATRGGDLQDGGGSKEEK